MATRTMRPILAAPIGRSLDGMARIVHQQASVEDLHALDPFANGPPDEPTLWWCDPTDSSIVLGSRQTADLLDHDACARAGLSIVRRRSGGGAVLVAAGEMVWIDLVLPHGSVPDDVRGSMAWAGERWLDALGRPADATVHREGMVCNAWSGLVCFAGIGPGEVLRGDRKLVGLSQRRTRYGIRIQGMVHRVEPVVASLFVAPVPDIALIAPALESEVDPRGLAEALAASIDAASA